MRVIPTDEMLNLQAIYRPYLKGLALSENAPSEAVKALDRYLYLQEEQIKEEVKSWFE